MKKYGKSYQRDKAIKLLNEIVNKAEDLTPNSVVNEEFKIKGDLFAEIYNFLNNNNIKQEA